jgi:hypothetical protein
MTTDALGHVRRRDQAGIGDDRDKGFGGSGDAVVGLLQDENQRGSERGDDAGAQRADHADLEIYL